MNSKLNKRLIYSLCVFYLSCQSPATKIPCKAYTYATYDYYDEHNVLQRQDNFLSIRFTEDPYFWLDSELYQRKLTIISYWDMNCCCVQEKQIVNLIKINGGI